MPIRDNKYARQSSENRARNNEPTLDEQLTRLEEDLRRLKIEYDIFFNNATRRPPFDTKNRVESVIKRLADDRTFTYAQRYRYNSLVARFTSFRDLWRRTIQEREEGRDSATQMRQARQVEQAANNAKRESIDFTCTDARAEAETVRQLYDALINAKRSCGEVTDTLSLPHFHRMIAAKTDKLKQQLKCERVLFSVSIENGQVSFKAKAAR